MPGFKTCSGEREKQRNLLQKLKCDYGHPIRNEKGEIIDHYYEGKDGKLLTPYQCWYFVRNHGTFPKSPNPPDGLVVPENPYDWMITPEESLALVAAEEKQGKKSGRKHR